MKEDKIKNLWRSFTIPLSFREAFSACYMYEGTCKYVNEWNLFW